MSPTEQVSALVDKLGDPSKMSKAQWVEFLEEVMTDCEGKLDAAREELAEEEG